MTNVGTFGNVMGTPIINRFKRNNAVIEEMLVLETEYGDVIHLRHDALSLMTTSY